MKLRRGLAAIGAVAATACGGIVGGGGNSNHVPRPGTDQLSACLASFPTYPHTNGSFAGSGGGGPGCQGASGTADSEDKAFAFYSKELAKGKWAITFASTPRTGLIYFASRTDPTLGGWVFLQRNAGGTSIIFTIGTDCPCGPPPSPS